MKNFKPFFVIIITFLAFNTYSQVGVGTTAPEGALDISSTNYGLLIPRVSLIDINDVLTITAPSGNPLAISTLIYNTIASGTPPNNVVSGFYYWNGSKWKALSLASSSTSWNLEGNSGINPLVDFIGTSDNKDIIFKRNNIKIGQLNSSNLALGLNALSNTVTGGNNIAIGIDALKSITNGENNVAIGTSSLKYNTTGVDNTAVGRNSLWENTTGLDNAAMGKDALGQNRTGSFNSGLGEDALSNNYSGSSNTAVGNISLNDNISGNYNTTVGFESLFKSKGDFNTAIGSSAGKNLTTGSRNILIGQNTAVPVVAGNDQLVIGNTIYGNLALKNIGIDVTNPTNKLEVNGKIKATDINFTGLAIYPDDTAAGLGGLTSGDVYKTSTGELRIKL